MPFRRRVLQRTIVVKNTHFTSRHSTSTIRKKAQSWKLTRTDVKRRITCDYGKRSRYRNMLGVFAEFERATIRDRVVAGLNRVRGTKKLGRPPMPDAKVEQIK